jgi:hypothetical protein
MGLAHSPRIVTDGLVLCLDAANPKSYPGSNTVWTDISGNGNNGALINGTELVKQNSIALDGSGDFLTLTNLSATYLSNDFCIESWVYVTSQANQTLFNTIPHPSFDINLNRGGSGQTALYIGNGSGWQTLDFRSSGTLVANQWHHIAVTRNANVITIWHNGVNQGSTSAFMPTGFGTSAYVGTYNGGTGENVNGKIYGYRIVSGSPVYTANFTPSPRVSNISGTQMIIGQDGGFVNSAQTTVVATPTGNTFVNDQSYMKFDGVDDFGTVSNNISPGTGDFAVSVWVNKSDVVANRYIWDFGSNGGTLSTGTSVTAGFRYYNPSVGYILGPTHDINTWYNITISRISNVTSFYSNGVLINSGTDNGNIGSWGTALTIGNYGGGGGYRHQGKLSNILVYKNKGLSAQEVQQNFNALRGRYGL